MSYGNTEIEMVADLARLIYCRGMAAFVIKVYGGCFKTYGQNLTDSRKEQCDV